MCRSCRGGPRCGRRWECRGGGDATGLEGVRKMVLRVCRFQTLGLRLDDALEVVAARLEGLAPFTDVGVVLAHPGPVGGLVDRDLETWMEHDLARPSRVLGDDLRGDVAPPDDRKHRCHVRRL